MVVRAVGDLVEGGLTKPRWRLAYWSARAIIPAHVGAAALVPPCPLSGVTPAGIGRDDRKSGVGIGVGGDVGDAAHGADAGHTVLVGGPAEEMAEPSARRLEDDPGSAVGESPGRLGDPRAGRVAGVEGGAPQRRGRAGRRPRGRPLSSGCSWDRAA